MGDRIDATQATGATAKLIDFRTRQPFHPPGSFIGDLMATLRNIDEARAKAAPATDCGEG